MYIIAIGWIWVVLLMAVAEATSRQGTVLGALITFVLYGVVPLSIVLYVMGAPGRRRLRRAAEAAQQQAASDASARQAPDGGGEAAADTVAAERKEP